MSKIRPHNGKDAGLKKKFYESRTNWSGIKEKKKEKRAPEALHDHSPRLKQRKRDQRAKLCRRKKKELAQKRQTSFNGRPEKVPQSQIQNNPNRQKRVTEDFQGRSVS